MKVLVFSKNAGDIYVYEFTCVSERNIQYILICQYFTVLSPFLFSSSVVTAMLCNRKHPEIFTSVVRANSFQKCSTKQQSLICACLNVSKPFLVTMKRQKIESLDELKVWTWCLWSDVAAEGDNFQPCGHPGVMFTRWVTLWAKGLVLSSTLGVDIINSFFRLLWKQIRLGH